MQQLNLKSIYKNTHLIVLFRGRIVTVAHFSFIAQFQHLLSKVSHHAVYFVRPRAVEQESAARQHVKNRANDPRDEIIFY